MALGFDGSFFTGGFSIPRSRRSGACVAGGLFQLAREGKKLRKGARATGKQLRRLHIWGFNVATGPGIFFSCNMQSPKVEKDLKWGCIMSRDLNWTIMISLFFRSFLQTRILRFSGERTQAQSELGVRDTRDGEGAFTSRACSPPTRASFARWMGKYITCSNLRSERVL